MKATRNAFRAGILGMELALAEIREHQGPCPLAPCDPRLSLGLFPGEDAVYNSRVKNAPLSLPSVPGPMR